MGAQQEPDATNINSGPPEVTSWPNINFEVFNIHLDGSKAPQLSPSFYKLQSTSSVGEGKILLHLNPNGVESLDFHTEMRSFCLQINRTNKCCKFNIAHQMSVMHITCMLPVPT